MANWNCGRQRLLALSLALVFPLQAAWAHGGDPYLTALFEEAYANAAIDNAIESQEAVEILVKLAAEVHNEAGDHLLPLETKVDRAEWVGMLVEVDLTLPIDLDDWSLSQIDLETISSGLKEPFDDVEGFAGIIIQARTGDDGEYQLLEQLIVQDYVPSVTGDADADFIPAPNLGGEVLSLSSQVSTAMRQPSGALTGVTVYTSAGHGWTAGNSSWFLQRPLLLGMNEDYGNIDQINIFCQYLFNAGATVVPLRPVGWQSLEIVLDQDDPEVSYTGSWSNSTGSPYYENGVTLSGISYRFATAAGVGNATARYTPNITVTDYYPVYCWVLASNNRVRQTYRIAHSGGISEVVVDHSNVGSGWVWLGDYYLESAGINYVEITNESPDSGVVIADAIRWGSGIGDISRPGPGSISGFPRDEEATRYWAESEYGNNAVGFSSSLWDIGGASDASDNVGAGARMAREMNVVPAGGVQSERWNRVHLEWHSNAFNASARGQVTLITGNRTTNQIPFATILSNEVDADMLILDDEFEHAWVDRASSTLTGSYGAISTTNNSNEFDATLIEVAFHDAPQDAELLRDATVRAAVARSSVQGIIRFLNSLSGSPIPLAFPPDTPRSVYAEDLGNGDIRLSWQAPLVDGARGDAATGYVVYQSSNGKGFGSPIVLGNVLTTTISGVAVGETKYYQIAATNTGGQSMPSEVLAVRRPATGTADVIIVNGFDRIDRLITDFDVISGVDTQRVIPRRINNFDYVIQHAEALAAAGKGFVSSSNDAVRNNLLALSNYDITVWILGNEANEIGDTEDQSIDAVEQSALRTYLENGGTLFVTGAEIVQDLITNATGVQFAVDTLRVGFDSDDVNTFTATGATNSILSDIPAFSFAPSTAPYPVYDADQLLLGADAVACLNYVGGLGGIAGIQYTGPVYNVVVFGFAFETIGSSSVRADIMQRVVTFLENASGLLPFDQNRDGKVDGFDFVVLQFCFSTVDDTYPEGQFCLDMDGDGDLDVDTGDFYLMQQVFTGP